MIPLIIPTDMLLPKLVQEVKNISLKNRNLGIKVYKQNMVFEKPQIGLNGVKEVFPFLYYFAKTPTKFVNAEVFDDHVIISMYFEKDEIQINYKLSYEEALVSAMYNHLVPDTKFRVMSFTDTLVTLDHPFKKCFKKVMKEDQEVTEYVAPKPPVEMEVKEFFEGLTSAYWKYIFDFAYASGIKFYGVDEVRSNAQAA